MLILAHIITLRNQDGNVKILINAVIEQENSYYPTWQ